MRENAAAYADVPSGASAIDIAHWDRLAEDYASRIGGPNDRIYAMLRNAIWTSLGPDVSSLDVLDLGCGHGWLTALLHAAGARVRGIDGSAALLSVARRLSPAIEFEQRDLVADALPTDRDYDRIVAHMVLMDLPDIEPLLAFVRRVLRPTGRFVLTMPHPCFFNYKTREDPATHDLYCGVSDYLSPAEWWIESYGGHRHYHRSLTFYVTALQRHELAVTALFEPPQKSENAERAAFYRGIPKFLLLETRPCTSGGRA